jgi:predicted ferric reductase
MSSQPKPLRIKKAKPPREAPLYLLVALICAGLGITIGLAVMAETMAELDKPGGWIIAGARVTGLVGAYLMLISVLLIARIPLIERVVGQDRLVSFHRQLGAWPLVLILIHMVLTIIGYAERYSHTWYGEVWQMCTDYPGVLLAFVGTALITLAGVTSYRIARRRLKYETWWIVHLYIYLALALSFPHQIATGTSFVGHPANRAWWIAIWIATAGVAILYRFLLPTFRSFRHQLKVVQIKEEAPGVVSLIVEGRKLERLAVSGGQFFQWRFLVKGHWWQAHPYSLSAMPRPPYLRVTIKDLGDASGAMRWLTPGTRVAIEGPYGTFTRFSKEGNHVLLAGAGVGVTPLRALLEDLPHNTDVVCVLRARREEDIPHLEEIRRLVERRDGRLHTLIGSREQVPMDQALSAVVPDIAGRDIYICGPVDFTTAVEQTAVRWGADMDQIHSEAFAF